MAPHTWGAAAAGRCFTCTQQQAEEQSSHTYHSGDKLSQANLEKFNAGQIQCLACVSQLSEGIS